jgi:hypothetical protein
MFQVARLMMVNFHEGRTKLMITMSLNAQVKSEQSIHSKIFPIEDHMLCQSSQGMAASLKRF